jgi:hypothetical protein
MRHIKLSLCLAVALSGFAFSGAQALGLNCAVGTSVNNHARIMLKGKTLTTCNGAAGCKCVSCYDPDGSVYSACYPLVLPMPK